MFLFVLILLHFFLFFSLRVRLLRVFLEKQYFVLLVMYFVKHQQLNK